MKVKNTSRLHNPKKGDKMRAMINLQRECILEGLKPLRDTLPIHVEVRHDPDVDVIKVHGPHRHSVVHVTVSSDGAHWVSSEDDGTKHEFARTGHNVLATFLLAVEKIAS